MMINKMVTGAKNFSKMESYALAFSKFAAAFAAIAFITPAVAQDFGETVSAAMDAFREVRSQSAAPEEVKAIFAKASEAEDEGCINFCGFYLGMPETDAQTLATYYDMRQDYWSIDAAPLTKIVFKMTFSLHGIRKITKGGNTFDELSQAVANRIGSMKVKYDSKYDFIGYEYENIDGQRAFLSKERGLVLEDNLLSRKADAEHAETERRAIAERAAVERIATTERIEEEHKAAAERAKTAAERLKSAAKRVHGKVQLWEGGPYWAETNIGAEEPWESGLYFWWGDTVGYLRVDNDWVARDGSSTNFLDNDPISKQTFEKNIDNLQSEGWVVSKDGLYVLAPEHDAAHVLWGGGWRMPTIQELRDLIDKCDWVLTTINGVEGYVVYGQGDYASSSIFFPAAGYGDMTLLKGTWADGDYWSSVPYLDYNGSSWCLSFSSSGCDTRYYGRSLWQPVRPVQGFDE